MDDAARREAFEALVQVAYEPLQRYLRRRTDPVTADDVLGDALLVLWRRFDDVPSEAPLAWCFGIARGCLANRLRGDRRQQDLARHLADVHVAESDPVDDLDLDEALAALPEKHREVLRLWAWEQLPPREIAVVLGISANAASIRLHRATGQLRQILKGRKTSRQAGHSKDRQGTENQR